MKQTLTAKLKHPDQSTIDEYINLILTCESSEIKY
jgi:hypothetical protein